MYETWQEIRRAPRERVSMRSMLDGEHGAVSQRYDFEGKGIRSIKKYPVDATRSPTQYKYALAKDGPSRI